MTADAFLNLLSDQIEAAEDEDDKTRLQKLGHTVGGMSREVLTDLLVAFIKSQSGLP